MGHPLSKKERGELVKRAVEEFRRCGVTEVTRDKIIRGVFGTVMIDPTISAEICVGLQNSR